MLATWYIQKSYPPSFGEIRSQGQVLGAHDKVGWASPNFLLAQPPRLCPDYDRQTFMPEGLPPAHW